MKYKDNSDCCKNDKKYQTLDSRTGIEDIIAKENVDPHFRDESPKDCILFCQDIIRDYERMDYFLLMESLENLAHFLKNFSPIEEFYNYFIDNGICNIFLNLIDIKVNGDLFNQTIWVLYWIFCSAIYEKKYKIVDYLLDFGITDLLLSQKKYSEVDLFYYYSLLAKVCCVSEFARNKILDSFSISDFVNELSDIFDDNFDFGDSFNKVKGVGMLIDSLTNFELDEEKYNSFMLWIIQYYLDNFKKMPDYLTNYFLYAICNVCCYDDKKFISVLIKQQFQSLIEEILIAFKDNNQYPDIVYNALLIAISMIKINPSMVCFDYQLIISISSSINPEHAILGFKLISKIIKKNKTISPYNNKLMIEHLLYTIQNRSFEIRKGALFCINTIVSIANYNEIISFSALIPSLIEFFQGNDDKNIREKILDIFYQFLFSGQRSNQCNIFNDIFYDSGCIEMMINLQDDEYLGEKIQEIVQEFFPEETA